MQRILLFILAFTVAFGLSAQTVLENFERSESTINWEAVNGEFAGTVDNPEDTTGRNPSANVGSYTKSSTNDFSLFRGTFTEPLDLTFNNRFTIQVYAGAASSLTMKLEGEGTAIEATENIAVANEWRTYTFDFSEAATSLRAGRIVLLFDPGVVGSSDTYLFDNIVVYPAGPCAGTVASQTVIDDFECQRNATYAAGFDELEVIVNPDKSGINTSDSVGQYTDREGPFVALVANYNEPIDLRVDNQLCMKIWAPVAGELRYKLEEEGTTGFVELGTRITEEQTGQWIEVCQSFTGIARGEYRKIVIFFNVNANGTDGDVYYIDDIVRKPTPAAAAIEDFEGGAKLAWRPLNDNAEVNGNFIGPIVNPDTKGNTSATVGSYKRGPSAFSTLTAVLPNGLNLKGNPQLNLSVWVPNDRTEVTLQLFSDAVGNKTATATVDSAQTWQTLSFNFIDFANVTDFERVNITFAPNTNGTDVYLFDNFGQSVATVDACIDVTVDPTVIDDFECQRNADYIDGREFLTVIDNPDAGTESPNRSSRVGRFIDRPDQLSRLAIDYDSIIDLRLRNQFSARVWAPIAGQLLFRLEGDGLAATQVAVAVDTLRAWSTYSADFSSAVGQGYTRAVLVFGAGTNVTEAQTYYVDDIRMIRPDYANSCISTFEDANYTITDWQYFENGSLSGNDFIVSANPDSSGLNKSLLVGTFEESADGTQTYAGMFAEPESAIVLSAGNKTVTMKVLMDVAGSVVLKLERGLDGVAESGNLLADYTSPGEWQELTFDLSSLPDGARYARLTLIMNFDAIPNTTLTHYFDDIAVGSGNCANLTSLFSPIRVADLRVYPNPIDNQLTIENSAAATLFTLTNLLGQQVKQLNVAGAGTQVQWPLADLPRGTYLLMAQDRTGRLVARTKIIKR